MSRILRRRRGALSLQFAVDTGGTFTDLVVDRAGR